MAQFEIFTDLAPKEKPPDGPTVTLAKTGATLYFNNAASDIIRKNKLAHVRLGVEGETLRGAIIGCDRSLPGALPLVESRKGRNMPGSYMVGSVTEFFDYYGMTDGRKHTWTLEWDEDNGAFLYRSDALEVALARMTRKGNKPSRRKRAVNGG